MRRRFLLLLAGSFGLSAALSPGAAPAQERSQEKQQAQAEAAPKPQAPLLTADEIKRLLATNSDIYILDVREPKEIEEGGALKGYVNIPIGELEGRLAEVPKPRPILAMCRSGRRSATASLLLEKNGYKVAGYAGMLEWVEKGYEVVRPEK